MKTYLFVLGGLLLLATMLNGQDTAKVRVEFQTRLNESVTLLQEVYLGEVNTEGWVGSHYAYQHGSLTRNEFLCKAPYTGYFGKDKSIIVVMPYNYKFTIDPKAGNQKWLLTPPGPDFGKSLHQLRTGGWGILLSTFALCAVTVTYVAQRESYRMSLDHYNDVKNMGFDPVVAPRAPHAGFLFLIPAVAYSISIPIFVSGRHLYIKNKPSAERIE